ncbi:MAG: hypothetical protein L6300_12730 [Syntrophaceae bacterium]|nr:hypothetical protein [Syntrophaceae bacterium]
MSENKTIQKHDGKTIRVEKSLYRIEVIATPAEISVYLHPLSGGDMAYSKTDTDAYQYTHGGKVYQQAVMKAKAIHKEIEGSIEPDIKE